VESPAEGAGVRTINQIACEAAVRVIVLLHATDAADLEVDERGERVVDQDPLASADGRDHTWPSSQIAISMKSTCTSSPIHLPSGRDSNRWVTDHLP
jgi:hypothetical protein